jgi:thiol-disulfide isomerase/thioredoxin
VAITEVKWQGTELTLRMPGFENRIVATLEGDQLRGTLTMIKAKGAHQQIPFTATYGQNWRFSRDSAANTATQVNLTGRWAVNFDGNGKPSPGVGEFTQTGELVTGTFLTTTGDHRFLAGEWRDGELRLSKFDGGHVFLYRATLDANGQLQGQFWSGLAWVEQWSARRDENASIGEAENATQLKAGGQRLDFRFPDISGANISLSDPYFRGKVVIVTLAGSWCPNCHDEAAFLAELHRQKRAAGLEIISLMFEQFGDFPQAAEAVYRFRDRYNIDYTTLIAGTSDKDDAASRLPQLNGVFAFPTTLFIDRAGVVRKIHTGFSGPATGKHYDKLVADFTATVDTLLAEPAPRS